MNYIIKINNIIKMSGESDKELFEKISKPLKNFDPKKDTTKDFCLKFTEIAKKYRRNLPKNPEKRKALFKPFLQVLVGDKELQDEDYNIDTILYYCNKNTEKKLDDTIDEIKQVVKTSIEIDRRTNQKTTISSIKYITNPIRTFTIVQVPESAFNRSVKPSTWSYDGSSHIFRPTSKNCPFYLSSGTSNEVNFPNVWFPFLRIKETEDRKFYDQDRGWIHKSSMLTNSRVFKNAFYQLFKDKFGEDIETKYKNTFIAFFEKFSHWWQVSISSTMDVGANSLWNHDPFLLKVKILALEYSFELYPRDNITHFKPRNEDEKITRYIIKDIEAEYNLPEDVNGWLDRNDALILKRD